MSFTESEIESIFDHLKRAGFDVPDDWDADTIGAMAVAILDALGWPGATGPGASIQIFLTATWTYRRAGKFSRYVPDGENHA